MPVKKNVVNLHRFNKYRFYNCEMIGGRTFKTFLFVFLSLFVSKVTFSTEATNSKLGEEIASEEEFDINEMIMGHIKDAHRFHFWGGEHNGAFLHLPVVLFDNGLKVFPSDELYYGGEGEATDAKTNEKMHYHIGKGKASGYALFDEIIYKTNNGQLHFENGMPVEATPFSISITKNVVILFIVSTIVCIFAFGTARYYKKNGAVAPKKMAKFIEPLVVFVRDEIARDVIGEKKYKKYTPFILTIFFFILVSNLLGLVPILGANLSGSITVTMTLALFTLAATVFSGNKNYWRHIFATPGVPILLLLIMIPIEIIGIFTKPFALMIRLFANMTAGHAVMLAFVGIIFINKSVAWSALSVPMSLFISVLEILVAFIQAYLFAILTALYIGGAVEEAHHE